ncbi:MAG: leucine--tRNA ligase [Methanobacteriaceae archaeon]|nr:leucine--tRNA ligase [Methanobacteriaceae archaeon]
MNPNIEKKWQTKWNEERIFESDPDNREKFFVTVAYPYPSGAMHIGHGRTYTVPDVYARFKRMQGYNVLFPMAWHVTGAPVIGIAKRIERKDPWTIDVYQNIHKVPEKELKKFADPQYIVNYFSNEYKNVMQKMGYSIDWRREFNTIDPQYQKFIEWQIESLKDKGLIRKGAHPVKYCPECENPVGDHDLLDGEGVGINELTLIKFEIDDAYLVPATFRPETLFGVTNLWLNPEEKYIKVRVDEEEWIISKMAYNNLIHQKKDLEIVEEIDAHVLIGRNVINPVTGEEHVILPASFVDPEYASGVVYSVPGHAPADFIALEDLKKDKDLLKKYDLISTVEKLEPRNVIMLKDFGKYPAKDMISKLGVKNQEDPKLKEATNELYKLEHAKGVMADHIPHYNGLYVNQARDEVIKTLLKSGKGDKMHDFAERPVICRCGSKCVVRIMEDQWFMKYSDQDWKEKTLKCLKQMQIIPEEVESNFEYYINWLQDWACSRRIGLGTKLPWDPQWIIEPLSDSTIYMAYYTIAKYLKEMDAENLDNNFFENIFLDSNKEYSETINEKLLEKIKNEFNYWYPLDWRLSAKDLIGNHLTFHLFHHSALFPGKRWPRGAVVFGMGLLEGNKMSSSKGNVILLKDAINNHGADVVRLFLMASAEPWQDFDWREKEVKGIKKRLEWFSSFGDIIEKLKGSKISLKNLKINFNDLRPINSWLVSQINMRIRDSTEALEKFQTRKALQEVLFLMKKDIDHYLYRVKYEIHDEKVLNEICDTLIYVIDIWIRLMTPFVPHTCEEMWFKYGGENLASNASWPEYNLKLIDEKVQKSEEIIKKLSDDIKEIKKIIDVKPKKIHVYIAPDWKWDVFEIADQLGRPDIGQIMGKSIKMNVHDNKKEIAEFAKKISREITKTNYVGRLDEYSVIKNSLEFLSNDADAEVIVYKEATYDPQGKSRNAMPYKPAIYIE